MNKRGVLRTCTVLPVLLSCAFLACGLGLFYVLAEVVASSGTQSAGSVADSSYIIKSRWTHAASNSTIGASVSLDAALANTTAELREMLRHTQEQIHSLRLSLPATIEEELQKHHGQVLTVQKQAEQQRQQQAKQQQHQENQDQQQQQQQKQMAQSALVPLTQAHHVSKANAACDTQSGPGMKLALNEALVAPVVIVAHNRVHYLAKCLMTVLRYWQETPENAERFPLFVSVDGGDQATMHFAAALNFGAQVQVIHNLRDKSRCKPNEGYCNLSVHYHMLLQLFFECHKAPRLIFLEEDLEIAPDFFSYFAAFAPLLDHDRSLLCVSAWNDHGQRGRAVNVTALYRTDIFPGLGWMLTAELGRELQQEWPDRYWDEYMREAKVRKGRQCIYPEVPRTHTFGKAGTSGGQFYDQHLAVMQLNKDKIDWSQQDKSQYEGTAYARHMTEALSAAQQLDQAVDLRAICDVAQPDHAERGDMVVWYTDNKAFQVLAKQLAPVLGDLKGDPPQPRGSYKGVVTVRCRGRRLFVARNASHLTNSAA